MPSNPICVRRTSTVEEADIIVAWLAEQGIHATVVDRENPGVLAFGLTDHEGIAICVVDEETARKAKELLREHDREHDAAEGTGDETVVRFPCSDCKVELSFPASERGSVQECPHCGTYVDVPA